MTLVRAAVALNLPSSRSSNPRRSKRRRGHIEYAVCPQTGRGTRRLSDGMSALGLGGEQPVGERRRLVATRPRGSPRVGLRGQNAASRRVGTIPDFRVWNGSCRETVGRWYPRARGRCDADSEAGPARSAQDATGAARRQRTPRCRPVSTTDPRAAVEQGAGAGQRLPDHGTGSTACADR